MSSHLDLTPGVAPHLEPADDGGVVECQVCRRERSVEEAIVLWAEDAVVFAVCHQCTRDHDIVMRPHGSGVQVAAKLRGAA